MNFYIEGNMIGFSIYSWYGVVFSVYVLLELIQFFSGTKMFMFHKLLISPYIFFQVNKMKPKYWRVINWWWILAMKRKSFNRFEMYIELISDLEHYNKTDIMPHVNDTLVLNFWGKIIQSQIDVDISKNDSQNIDKVKQFNRNEKLKDLGI